MPKNDYILRFKLWFYSILNKLDEIKSDSTEFKIYRNQIIRSSSGSYMNYRSTARAKSTADFKYKLKIVEEELDETMGWLEIISERFNIDVSNEMNESDQLLRIIVSSIIRINEKK